MEIRVNIPDELAAQARSRGLRPEAYVEEILMQMSRTTSENKRPRTPAEIREWLDALAQFSDKIPALPETVSRAWIYHDHD